jgi:acetyl esterase/lipase
VKRTGIQRIVVRFTHPTKIHKLRSSAVGPFPREAWLRGFWTGWTKFYVSTITEEQLMRTIAAFFVAVTVAPLACGVPQYAKAEPAAVIKLWPSEPPGPKHQVNGPEQDINKPADKPIAGRRIIKLTNVSAPEMHVFLPAKDRRNGAAIVICPGGGFNILAWDLEGTEVAEWLDSIGVAGIVLKYRVPMRGVEPKWLPPVQDAQRAISLARSHAADWGIDPKRVGVLGFSAGGNPAGMVAVKNGSRQYAGVDDADKLPCRPDFAVLIYPAGMYDDKRQQLREEVEVTKDLPPFFMVQAFDDHVSVQNSLALTMALKKAGVPCELHVYDRGGHGYGLRPQGDLPVTTWPACCQQWLKVRGLLSGSGQ